MSQQSPKNTTAELVAAVAIATADCTSAMNEQFVALIENSPDLGRFDARIAETLERRRQAMSTLLDHIAANGW